MLVELLEAQLEEERGVVIKNVVLLRKVGARSRGAEGKCEGGICCGHVGEGCVVDDKGVVFGDEAFFESFGGREPQPSDDLRVFGVSDVEARRKRSCHLGHIRGGFHAVWVFHPPQEIVEGVRKVVDAQQIGERGKPRRVGIGTDPEESMVRVSEGRACDSGSQQRKLALFVRHAL